MGCSLAYGYPGQSRLYIRLERVGHAYKRGSIRRATTSYPYFHRVFTRRYATTRLDDAIC